jgi:hypothetical protein
MGKPSAPPAPDYKAAAAATASGNQNAALAAQMGNMTNQAGPTQYAMNPDGSYKLDASGNKISQGSTGVSYNSPAKADQWGNMPFDQSKLSPAQKATYAATGKLPAKFDTTYLPQQWTQQQTLGENDQYIFDKNQAVNMGLTDLASKGVNKVGEALENNISPNFAIQGAPETTAGQMTTNVAGEFAGGGLDTSGVQNQVADSGAIQASLSDRGDIQSDIADAGSIQASLSDRGDIQSDIADAGAIQNRFNDAGDIQSQIAAAGDITNKSGATGLAQTALANNADKIQTSVGANQNAGALSADQNNSAKLQTNLGLNPQLLQQQTSDALYKANTQYLDPQFNQQQQQIESKLANQGITRGSEAYNNAMLNFNNQKQQAYESARNNAISGATSAAQGMFGMGLQGAQFGNQSLGQQFGQNVTAQSLANAAAGQNNAQNIASQQANNQALGQQFNQGLSAAGFGNQAVGQNNTVALANAQFANQAQGQQFGQNAAMQQAQNTAQQQAYNQNLGTTQFANQAQGQQFSQNAAMQQAQNAAQQQAYNQNLGTTQFANQAQAQQYAQNQAAQQAQNAAQQQAFNQDLSAGTFANASQAQQFGQNQANQQAQNAAVAQNFGMGSANQQALNNAQLQRFNAGVTNANLNNQQLTALYNQGLQGAQQNNAASAQDLQQQQMIQQNPINMLNAVRSGSQMQTANLPSVGVSQPGQLANWQGADMLGAATAQGQYDQSVYNAKAAAQAQMTSSLIGAGGALGGAGIMAASDRRLKKNIKRIGTHVLGIGLYTWDYLWGEPFAGVMADEVEQVMPEAIVMHPSGFKMVNYLMLGLV